MSAIAVDEIRVMMKNLVTNWSENVTSAMVEEFHTAFVNIGGNKNAILTALKEVTFAVGPKGGFIKQLPALWTNYDEVTNNSMMNK